jgi:hypothetical protein
LLRLDDRRITMRSISPRSALIAAAIAAGVMLVPSAAQAQRCPANANQASGAVWAWGTIRTGQTVTATHPCGRRIQCVGGERGSKESRSCRWL